MRRILILLLTASMGMPIACSDSDRSPTSPVVGTSAVSSAAADTRSVTPPGNARHVVVVAPHSDRFLQPGVWGSANAGLTVTMTSGKLDILATVLHDGGCFGSYGDTAGPIPNGAFTIPGTFTQLTGVYPGKIEYAAQFSGLVESNRMSISVHVPALGETLGPFSLTRG